MMRHHLHPLLTPLRLWLLSPPACRSLAILTAGLAGRTVLVTGASQGIGEATARLLARAGADVLLVARDQARLTDVADAIRQDGGRAWVYPCDLASPDTIQDTARRICKLHPQLQMVVSNAGKSIRRPVTLAAQKRDLERSLAVNFSGPAALLLCWPFCPGCWRRTGP
jgi:NAD(P)-dependent dehydrogenase (short-subunit alcohol dehydrogenase family)